MGCVLDDFGKMSVEVRRESFIIHPSYGYKGPDGEEHDDSEPWKIAWRENPHPEFMLADLDDLIAALQDARGYLTRTRGFPPITRRCRFCGNAAEACHKPCRQTGDGLHSIQTVRE